MNHDVPFSLSRELPILSNVDSTDFAALRSFKQGTTYPCGAHQSKMFKIFHLSIRVEKTVSNFSALMTMDVMRDPTG